MKCNLRMFKYGDGRPAALGLTITLGTLGGARGIELAKAGDEIEFGWALDGNGACEMVAQLREIASIVENGAALLAKENG